MLAVFANAINQSPTAHSYLLRGAQLLANGAAGPQQYMVRGAVRVNARVLANTLVVDLVIRPGWHINAYETLQAELIPTRVGLEKPVPGPLIPVALRLQACDDSVCLPPERRLLQVPANHPPSTGPGVSE